MHMLSSLDGIVIITVRRRRRRRSRPPRRWNDSNVNCRMAGQLLQGSRYCWRGRMMVAACGMVIHSVGNARQVTSVGFFLQMFEIPSPTWGMGFGFYLVSASVELICLKTKICTTTTQLIIEFRCGIQVLLVMQQST